MLEADPVHLVLKVVIDPWDGTWFLNGLDFFPCEKAQFEESGCMVLSMWNINIVKALISSCHFPAKNPFNSSLFLGEYTFIHLLIQKIFTKCLPYA